LKVRLKSALGEHRTPDERRRENGERGKGGMGEIPPPPTFETAQQITKP
jgi:hypothetical protein